MNKILAISVMMLTACQHSPKNEDNFYTASRAWDFIRFPLIKPYQGMSIPHQSKEWELTLMPQDGIEDGKAANVIKLSVIDTVIFAACGDSTVANGQWVKAAWFIIIPKQKKEQSFLTEDDFNNYIKVNNLPTPKWIGPEAAWEEFNRDHTLPWLKGSN